MAFESLADAAAALADANADEAPATPEVAPETAPVDAERASTAAHEHETTTQVEAERATLEDSFTKVDLTQPLPDDPQEALRVLNEAKSMMLADYTRKTQDAAPYRKMAEEFGGDADELRQSVEFVQNLRSDPDFAVAVHRELSDALQDAGLTEVEADVEAGRQLEQRAEGDPFVDTEFDPEDPRDAALQELLAFRDEYVDREEERALEAEIQRMEMAVRQSNPDYTDTDMDEIVKLSFAYGGDLLRAEEDYRALQERFVSAYLEGKETVETTVPRPAPETHHAEQPKQMSFDDAHKAALRHLHEVLGS